MDFEKAKKIIEEAVEEHGGLNLSLREITKGYSGVEFVNYFSSKDKAEDFAMAVECVLTQTLNL